MQIDYNPTHQFMHRAAALIRNLYRCHDSIIMESLYDDSGHRPARSGLTADTKIIEPLPRRAPAVSLVLTVLSVLLVWHGVYPTPLL